MIVVHFAFQREWHLPAILNEQPSKILHGIQMRRRKCLCIKQYAEEQYVWAENQRYTVDNFW